MVCLFSAIDYVQLDGCVIINGSNDGLGDDWELFSLVPCGIFAFQTEVRNLWRFDAEELDEARIVDA